MDADLNNYDVEHVCTAHPEMSKAEWEAIYREAWSLYYTPEHMWHRCGVRRRTSMEVARLVKVFDFRDDRADVHPLQGALLRSTPSSGDRNCCGRCWLWGRS